MKLLSEKQWASKRDLPSYWPDTNKRRRETKAGGMEASLSGWVSLQGCGWLIQFICETKWFGWKMSASLKRTRPGPNVCFSPGKLLHSTRCKNKIQFLKKIHGNLSQSLLHRPQCPRPPSRSANIQTECANVVRNAEPFENNLTRTIDKELSAVPENILFSHPLWEVLYTELFLNLKWVSLCATKLMEERISERLRKKCSYAITSTRKWQIKVLIAHTPTSNQTNSRGSCVPF